MPDSVHAGSLDCRTLACRFETAELTPVALATGLLQRLETCSSPAVWIDRLPPEELLAQARALEQRRAAGGRLPLYGLPFAVKDNMDVAGQPTTAACPAFRYVPSRTAPAVQRLLDAGALLVGKTNLDQFACGLAGDRSPYGACRNVFDPAYIAGGSSSGSAVAVAAGLVSFALGTDTAGSGRVPAGCSNIVGLKPTPGQISTEGVVPACASLDCVSVLALTVSDAFAVFEVLRGGSGSPLAAPDRRPVTFAVPRPDDLEFFGDHDEAQLFDAAQGHLAQLGWQRVAIDFKPFQEMAALLYEGPWLAERLGAVEEFLKAHAAEVHPVTRSILEKGARYRGVEVFQGLARRQALREACLKIFERAEVLVVPTMPALPTLAAVQADSAGWSRRLGHYTNFANLLGMAALAVPAGFTPRGRPGGVTLLAPGGSDRRLAELGLLWQRHLDLPLGATRHRLPAPEGKTPSRGAIPPVPAGQVRVAVAGAHLQGQPLHPALLKTGARYVRTCRTAAGYRFVALMDLEPPRPGLLREEGRPGVIEVELYDLPMEGFGMLVASVAPPLAIGTVELADGETVKGFLCESWAAARARDITAFGGWLAFREHLGQVSRSPAGPPRS